MNILILSPAPEAIKKAVLIDSQDSCVVTSEKISLSFCLNNGIDYIISYRYRHIIGGDIIDRFGDQIINLHTSLLPSQRGAHPIFWAVVEGTPLGVTIHMVDKHLDTGDILFQEQVDLDLSIESFASTYLRLSIAIEDLFMRKWSELRTLKCAHTKQNGTSSYHRAKELTGWLSHLPASWDTNIEDFRCSACQDILRYRQATSAINGQG